METGKHSFQTVGALFGIKVEHLEETSSTNELAAAKSPFRHGDVILADFQTAGKGQRGNRWHSAKGENLMFSIVTVPSGMAAEEQFYISKVAALSVAHSFAAYGIAAEVKWPNDIYVAERKIAGILIENELMGPDLCKSIVGIGINLNQSDFDPALPNPTSFVLEKGESVPREEFFHTFLEKFFYWWTRFESRDLRSIDEGYGRLLYRRKGSYRFREPGGEPFSATLERVMATGQIVLRDTAGAEKLYSFKEVEFI